MSLDPLQTVCLLNCLQGYGPLSKRQYYAKTAVPCIYGSEHSDAI